MSDYLISPVKGCWKNWQKLAQRAGVEFSEEDRIIGEAIFSHKPNKFPVARPRVVKVFECFGPSDPSIRNDPSSIFWRGLPAHPVILLTLMTGIGNEEVTEHQSWTYRTIASTLLLAHPSGQVYTFLLDGGDGSLPEWKARFLLAGKWIGRSMYIHQYTDIEGFGLSSYFIPNEEGKYGRSYTSFR